MRTTLLSALLLAGCATGPQPTGRATDIAGNWQNGGLTVAISTFSSFSAKRGCTVTGGMLRPIAAGRYRIDRYGSGYATEGCGPWRVGPEIAPFGDREVSLFRSGRQLIAHGSGRTIRLTWIGPASV